MLESLVKGKFYVDQAKTDNGKFPTQLHIIPLGDSIELVIQQCKTRKTERMSCKISRELLIEMMELLNAS